MALGTPLARIVPGGLRWRLAGWIALVTLICTGIAFVAVYRGTGTQLRRQIDQEISGDAAELAHNLTNARVRSPVGRWRGRRAPTCTTSRSAPARRSCSRSSRGRAPATNRPELFGARPARQRRDASRAERRRTGSRAAVERTAGYATLALPDVGNLRLLKRVGACARRAARDDRGGRAAGERDARPERPRTRVHPRRDAGARSAPCWAPT